MSEELEKLEKIIGIEFKNKNLLRQALIHRSYLNEAKDRGLSSNERMEFLGDSILSFWISRELYERFPSLPEGKLTFIRTHLVRTETLYELAKQLMFGNFLLMSKGEEAGGGRENPLLLANSFEAVLGSIFLDSGFEYVKIFLSKQFTNLFNTISDPDSYKDSKSLFQEKVQSEGFSFPVYKLINSEGPDHQKLFTMGVFVEDKLIAQGVSRSKQEAEEEAARKALEIYKKIK